MMNDLISKSALVTKRHYDDHDVAVVDWDDIDKLPPIEPKKGKWKTKFTPTECNPFGDYPILIMRCSACETKITLMHEDENIKEKWHYCPNCGAKMERSEE